MSLQQGDDASRERRVGRSGGASVALEPHAALRPAAQAVGRSAAS
jgi:hypothetical protein